MYRAVTVTLSGYSVLLSRRGGKAKKIQKIKIETLYAVACSKKISLFNHRRDINIPTYVNICIYGFIYLDKWIQPCISTHTSITVFTWIHIVYILSTHAYIIITLCVHTYTPISGSARKLSREYTHTHLKKNIYIYLKKKKSLRYKRYF